MIWWIIGVAIWLLIGYASSVHVARKDNDAPPVIIVACMVLLGPVFLIEYYIIEFVVNVLLPKLPKSGIDWEKYTRKFLRMKEKS